MRLGLGNVRRLGGAPSALPTSAPPALPTLAITAGQTNLAEGNSGTVNFTFTVARSGDLSGASSVDWAVAGSGANPADAADFVGGVLPSGTLNFVASDASETITVQVSGDTANEPDNEFTVTLSNPTGATITAATAVSTITNDDAPSGPAWVHLWELNDNGGDTTTSAGRISDVTDQGSSPHNLSEGTAANQFTYVVNASPPGDHGLAVNATERLVSTNSGLLADVTSVGTWLVAFEQNQAAQTVVEYILRGGNNNQHRWGLSIYNGRFFIGTNGTSFTGTGQLIAGNGQFLVAAIIWDGTNLYLRQNKAQVYTAAVASWSAINGFSIGAKHNAAAEGPNNMKIFAAGYIASSAVADADAAADDLATRCGVTL